MSFSMSWGHTCYTPQGGARMSEDYDLVLRAEVITFRSGLWFLLKCGSKDVPGIWAIC